jgi:hypothetical protein
MDRIDLTNNINYQYEYTNGDNTFIIKTMGDDDGSVCYEIYLNNNPLPIQGFSLALPSNKLIKVDYLGVGNFVIVDIEDESIYPAFERFNINQFLYYMSQEEMDE